MNGLVPFAKRVYQESVLWHGTKREHVSSLRRNGFVNERKGSGATDGGSANFLMNFSSSGVTASGEHHYLSSDREMAKEFAMFADADQPAVVRTIGVGNNFHLEEAPILATLPDPGHGRASARLAELLQHNTTREVPVQRRRGTDKAVEFFTE
ncbi:hypothetical protein KAF44_25685 (plasmid) [Cupriavidus necator]|nr:hypothetical protein KAF44_25685 [Cupriavidus necator]